MSASATTHRGLRKWAGEALVRWPWVLDAYRYARNPAWERAVARDLRETRAASRFLGDLPSPGPSAPIAVVGLYRDDVFDAKVGLVLASALRTRGVHPVVLVPSARNHRLGRYADAFGIDDVRARDKVVLDDAVRARIRDVAEGMLAGPTDIEAARDWTFDGHAAGYHVVSTVIRRTFDGSPDLHVDANRALLRAVLYEVLETYAVCDQVLADLAPALVLVEEANYAHNGPLVDVAVSRDIDVIRTIQTWRDDALMSKRLSADNRRVDARSVAPETLARRAPTVEADAHALERALDRELDDDFTRRYGGEWVMSARDQPGTRPFTGEEIVAALGIDPDKPTAVVFAHVLWDASLFFGVDLFANYTDWLRRTVVAAADNPNVNWLVKTHPSNVFRVAHGDIAAGASSEAEVVRDALAELPAHVTVLPPETPISTLSLYRFADYGITVRGTAGLEMACFGKAVLTAGTGAYSGLGFTYDSYTKDEYLARIAKTEALEAPDPAATARARRFAHTLFLRRPWIARSFRLRYEFPEQGWHPLDRNVEWAVGSVDELATSPDLGAWADWALGSDDADFLPPAGASPASPSIDA